LKDPGHRLFFALRPATDTLEEIISIQRLIRGGEGRATPADRIHATLLFLGQQSGETLTSLGEIASSLDFPPCRLALERLGYFPRARVAWLGSSGVPPELASFQSRLSLAVQSAGITFDQRQWTMHVTLYRDLRKPPGRMEFEPVEWRISRFHLLESVQDRSGLRYRDRGRWPA
jgi:2'-5' RNA ligase